MLYPNTLQLNLKGMNMKKRHLGSDDQPLDTPSINTPKILSLICDAEEEKSRCENFVNNQFFVDRPSKLEKNNSYEQNQNIDSIENFVVELNQNNVPYFTHSLISPSENYNCVAPDDVFSFTASNNTVSSVTSSVNTTTPANVISNQNFNTTQTFSTQSSVPSALCLNNNLYGNIQDKESNSINHSQQNQSFSFSNYNQASNYSSNQINSFVNQDASLNMMNINNISNTNINTTNSITINTNSDIINQQSSLSNEQAQVYTDLKPRRQQESHYDKQNLIPNSVQDISVKYHCLPRKSYSQASSPTHSSSSHTSSSNLDAKLDNKDYECYNDCSLQESPYANTSLHQNSTFKLKRTDMSSSPLLENSKKSRLTKRQKFDQMVAEEKNLIADCEKLKNEINNLELLIKRYKDSLMEVMKRGTKK